MSGACNALELAPPLLRSIEFEGVSVEHGRTRALHRCSVRVGAGECVAVLGPNGAGKSTLLHVAATLVRPTEGRVRFDGRYDGVAQRASIRPHIGLVAHDGLLYGDLTGRENLEFWAKLYGVDPSLATRWLEAVGMTAAGDRPVRTYSRGMRQRLSIARALLSGPSIVLLDEPFTGIDRAGQSVVWDTLRWLRANERTVLVVTHELVAPPGVFTRTLVLDRGSIRADRAHGDTLAETYDAAVGR